MNQQTENAVRSFEKWRHEIDRIDSEVLGLLNLRARIARELGVIKIARGLPAYDGRRERQVLARVRQENPGPLSAESVTSIFRRIILETRRIGIQSMREQRKKTSLANHHTKEHRNGH